MTQSTELNGHRSPEHWRAITKGVANGCRNHSAASLAGLMLRRGFDAYATLDLMLGWNTRNTPPLPEAEIVRTVESIAARELARRQGR